MTLAEVIDARVAGGKQQHSIDVWEGQFSALAREKSNTVEVASSLTVGIGDVLLLKEYRPGRYSGHHYEEEWIPGRHTGSFLVATVTAFARKQPRTNPPKTVVTLDLTPTKELLLGWGQRGDWPTE